jgi:hypothetical protein
MKKFFKRNRYTCILIFIFILLIILGLKVKDIFVPDEGKPVYGERLKCAEKKTISEEVYTKADEALKKNKSVTKVTHRLQGKTINYYITFTDKTSVKDARGVGDGLVKSFDEDTLACYSLQVYLLKDDEKLNNFPIIGMKHPDSKTISWTKDREITVESEKDEE